MARFNTQNKVRTATTNLAGGSAYTETPKLEMASLLLTSFLKEEFYRTSDDTIKQLKSLVEKNDPLFCAKASVYARKKHGLRTITHVTAAMLAQHAAGKPWAKKYYKSVIHRPDDILEILAYYKSKLGKTIPHAMQKGFATALQDFDEYELAKYRGEGKDIKLVDAVNLVHPKHTVALTKLMKGELKNTETWEAKLTEAGQKAETDEEKELLKKAAWTGLITERKIGYFALLRNMRNIITSAPEAVEAACAMLTDEKLIRKSLVLPFRYITAIKEIQKIPGAESRQVLVALNRAVDLSLSNVPSFDGKTLVVLDESGSMTEEGHTKNGGTPYEIGSLFAAVLVKRNPKADLMLFGDRARYVQVNPLDTTLTIASSVQPRSQGTDFHCIIPAIKGGYDRIIVLSDMQGWMGDGSLMSALHQYRSAHSLNTKVYSFDLKGYGTLQFPEKEVYCLAGWSEKIFDVMKLLEEDRNALVKEIEAIEL